MLAAATAPPARNHRPRRPPPPPARPHRAPPPRPSAMIPCCARLRRCRGPWPCAADRATARLAIRARRRARGARAHRRRVPWKISAGQPVARRRRLEQELGAGLRQSVGRAAPARRRTAAAGSAAARPPAGFGRLAKISSKRASMVAKPALHAPFDQRQVGRLAALVLPALEHGRQQDRAPRGCRRSAPRSSPCA